MKLKLSEEKKITILTISEDVTATNTEIIRAGIVKLLKSGKNRLVLNLVDAQKIPLEVLKLIVKLHSTATELKGSIVLCGQGELLKQAVLSFSNPPTVKYFTNLEAAISSLQDNPNKEPEKSTAPSSETVQLKEEIKKLENENKTLKGKLQAYNPDEAKKLKAENAELTQKIKLLENQVSQLLKERKKPFDMDSMKSKVTELEAALTDALQKEGLVAKQ